MSPEEAKMNFSNLAQYNDDEWYYAAQSNTINQIKKFVELYPNGCGKTLVFGHWATAFLKETFNGIPADVETWSKEKWVDNQHQLIGMDTTTLLTHHLDPLIIED